MIHPGFFVIAHNIICLKTKNITKICVRLWIKKNLICLHVLLKVFDSWTHTKHLHGWVKSKSTKEGISLFSLCLVAMNSQEPPLHGWIFKCGQIFFQSSCNSALMRMSQITNANDSYQSTVSVFQHEREFASLRLWRSLLFISSLLKRFCYVSVIMPHRDLSGGKYYPPFQQKGPGICCLRQLHTDEEMTKKNPCHFKLRTTATQIFYL